MVRFFCLLVLLLVASATGADETIDVAKIHGRIQVVSSFPDYRVKVVESFADLHVQVD